MTTKTPATRQATYTTAELEKLRTTMFEVHPDICGRPAPLPRRTDGKTYTELGGEDAPPTSV